MGRREREEEGEGYIPCKTLRITLYHLHTLPPSLTHSRSLSESVPTLSKRPPITSCPALRHPVTQTLMNYFRGVLFPDSIVRPFRHSLLLLCPLIL